MKQYDQQSHIQHHATYEYMDMCHFSIYHLHKGTSFGAVCLDFAKMEENGDSRIHQNTIHAFAEGTETATGTAVVDITGLSMSIDVSDTFSTPWANVVTGASNTWTEVNAA
mgnify:CR=1 FL=1